jgi:hypothetical protein
MSVDAKTNREVFAAFAEQSKSALIDHYCNDSTMVVDHKCESSW